MSQKARLEAFAINARHARYENRFHTLGTKSTITA